MYRRAHFKAVIQVGLDFIRNLLYGWTNEVRKCYPNKNSDVSFLYLLFTFQEYLKWS